MSYSQLSTLSTERKKERGNKTGSFIITTNLEFGNWAEVFGNERMTAALLDRLTHRCHIIQIKSESYRFKKKSRLW
jgi:DNA replication protein DnaC